MSESLYYAEVAAMAVMAPHEDLANGAQTMSWTLAPEGEVPVVFDSGRAGRPALIRMLEETIARLQVSCTAEHENALHFNNPEPGCPECVRDAAEDVEPPQVHVVELDGFDGIYLFEHADQAATFAELRSLTPGLGVTPVLDRAAADKLIREQPCPECGADSPCELAPCGDPGCDARDCQSHETCERAPEPPGRYLPLDNPTP